MVTMCGHVFCYQCISGHLTGDVNACPAAGCKDIIGAESVFSGSTLRSCLSGESVESSSGVADRPERTFHSSCKIDAAMDILRSICKIQQRPEPDGERRAESAPPREDHASSSSEAAPDSSTKASESEPPVKAIVFSQWTGMLDFLEVSLNHSLLQYRRLDGSMSLASRERAVKDFNTDPEV